MADYRIEDALEKSKLLADSSAEQKTDAYLVLAPFFEVVGGDVVHKETGLGIDDPKVREKIEAVKPHLFPAKFERSLADRAFADGNITARAQLVREVGEVQATRIAKDYGLRGLGDTAKGKTPEEARLKLDDKPNNPWSRSGWNVTKQGQLIKAMGTEKAAAIARAAGSRIGATRPVAA